MTDAAEGYEALLRFVCVEHGWCGGIKDGQSLQVDMFIPDAGKVTSDQFAEWLCRADNLEPAAYLRYEQLKETVRGAFIRFLGAEAVDVTALRFSNGS